MSDAAMIVAGAIACLGLSGAGSALGTGLAASAAVGAWKKCYAANKPAPFLLLGFVGAPITQTLYGMILMFVSLCTGIVRLESVRTVGMFLIEIMPVMFIPAAVGLLDSWDALKSMLLPCCIALVPVTLIVMAVSGRTTQALVRAQNQKRGENK